MCNDVKLIKKRCHQCGKKSLLGSHCYCLHPEQGFDIEASLNGPEERHVCFLEKTSSASGTSRSLNDVETDRHLVRMIDTKPEVLLVDRFESAPSCLLAIGCKHFDTLTSYHGESNSRLRSSESN